MSSGFVSGGTVEQPVERNELWKQAEQEIEAARRRKEEIKAHDGKSLYEVLQANKAAKQEAFEEAAKLKNQFRSLDEDDVHFLNSVRDADLAKESATRQETREQIDAFRRQQQKSEQSKLNTDDARTDLPGSGDNGTWRATAKKRKRADNLKGVQGPRGTKATKASVEGNQIPGRSDESASVCDDPQVERGEVSMISPMESPDLANPKTRTSQTAVNNLGKSDSQVPAVDRPSKTAEKDLLLSRRSATSLGLSEYSSDTDDDD